LAETHDSVIPTARRHPVKSRYPDIYLEINVGYFVPMPGSTFMNAGSVVLNG